MDGEAVGLADGSAEGGGEGQVFGGLPMKAVLSTIGDPAIRIHVR